MGFNYNHIIVVITQRIFSSHQEVFSGPFAFSSLSYLLHLSESLFKKDSCSSAHNSTQAIFLLDQEATHSLRSRIRPLLPAARTGLDRGQILIIDQRWSWYNFFSSNVNLSNERFFHMEGGGKGKQMAIFHKSRMSVTTRSTVVSHTNEKGKCCQLILAKRSLIT